MYLSMAPTSVYALDQKMPFTYDSLLVENFGGSRSIVGSAFRSKDRLVERGYGKDGRLVREFACTFRIDSRCERPLLNEWRATGKPKIPQSNLGGNRYRNRHFYEDGTPMTESHYLGTKLDGVYPSWWESGKINQVIEYRGGQEVSWKEWDRTGKLVKDEGQEKR